MASFLISYLRAGWRVLASFALGMLALHLVLFLSVPLRQAWAEIAYLDLLLAALGAGLWLIGLMRYRSRYRYIRQALAGDGPVADALDDRPRAEDVRILTECIRREVGLAQARHARLEAELREQRNLLALWAHEVKTPLAVCRLILSREEAEPVRNPLAAELRRIEAQVSTVLHAERLRHLEQSVVMRKLPLSPLLRAAVARNAELLRARSLEVELEMGPGAPDAAAMGDEQGAGYILDQLLTNAAKYAPEGGAVRLSADCGDKASIRVSNAGAGIPEQDLARVFDKGFTGELGRAAPGASGMGLYYARQTARALGGRLSVSSRPGETTFTLELPVFQAYLSPASKT